MSQTVEAPVKRKLTVKGDPDCTRCPLHATAQAVCLMGRGPVNEAEVMIIGEAPGLREDEIGKPFQGKSGKLLTKILESINVDRETLYITNTVRCRPPDNRTPKKNEIAACNKWMKREMRKVDPKFVLMLGSTAVKAQLGDKEKITEVRGKFLDKDGKYYFATFHPSAALMDPKKEKVIRADLAKFFEAVRKGKPQDAAEELNVRIVRSLDHLNECVDDLRKYKVITYDLETTGLKPYAPETNIVCIGLATPKTQWIVPLYHAESPFKTEAIRQMVAEVIHEAVKDKYLVGHNAKFDSGWLKKMYGLDFHCGFDTMLAHYVLDENSNHGLKELSMLFFGAEDYDIKASEKTGHVKLEKLATYCAYDVYYTRKLYNKFKKELVEDDSLWELFDKIVMPAARAYVQIEANGVYVYEERLDQAEEYWKERLNNCIDRLDRYLEPYKKHWPNLSLRVDVTKKKKPTKKEKAGRFNWGSGPQLSDLLFNKMKLKVLDKTEKGAPSTNESVMLRLAAENPIARDILEYREAYKQLSSFIESWKNKIYQSRLHPSFKLHGAVTGRTSCVEPNLQQVPRDPRIRTLIGAPPEPDESGYGWTMVEADQSQVELRVAAIVSGDLVMKHAFQVGEDLHTKTARATTGKMELTKEERKKAKAVNFGFLYGMGAKKFVDYARDSYGAIFTLEEAQRIRSRFFEAYPGLPKWHQKQRRIANNYGLVRSLVGRVRHLPNVYSSDKMEVAQAERQAINSPVQGFASDLILMAVVELMETFDLEYFRIVGTVHDAILMEIRNDKLRKVIPQIKAIMEKPTVLREMGVVLPIPLVADVSVGSWGAGQPVEFTSEPPTKEDGKPDDSVFWYNDGKLYHWTENGWESMKGNKINGIVSNYTEKLLAKSR